MEYANLVIATGNGGFRCQFGTVFGEAIQSKSKVPQYLIFFFLIYNIIDCVFCYDGAFLTLHIKFRYLVSSLALWDCLC